MVDYSKIHAEYLRIQEAKDLVDKYTTIINKLIEVGRIAEVSDVPDRFAANVEDLSNWLIVQASIIKSSYSE